MIPQRRADQDRQHRLAPRLEPPDPRRAQGKNSLAEDQHPGEHAGDQTPRYRVVDAEARRGEEGDAGHRNTAGGGAGRRGANRSCG
jgi:hypothetical protein